MNDEMPWVNLTQEEVEELRNKKHELTEYGKQRLRELIYKEDMRKMEDAAKDLYGPYPDEMFEEAERREAERKALDAVDKLYKENGNELLKLAEIEKEEWERKVRSDRILERYNSYHNLETSGLPHGTPITAEQQQMIAFRSMIDAFKCDHLNQEYTHIAIDDIENLIEGLYQQSIAFLDRVKKSRYNAND
jgi:hypothetical protein